MALVTYTQIFQIFAGALVLVLAILMLRYLLLSSKEKSYFPEQWIYLLRTGKLPEQIKTLEKQYPDKVRFFNLWFQTERLKREKIPGSFAELGVYKGETAKILHYFDKNRKLHLFDTFEGFAEKDLKPETGEAATYSTKNFADTTVEKVLQYIDGNKNIIIHKGYFPDTTRDIPEESYAMVTIDTDLYNPVKEGLNYFYPLLSSGGVILVHDYTSKWEGLVKAVDEFVTEIPENLIEVPDMFGTVMIIKNKKVKP
jgi:O-methyltransferase